MAIVRQFGNAPGLGGTPADSIATSGSDLTGLGIDLLVMAVAWQTAAPIPTVSDTPGNVWSYVGGAGATASLRLYYTVGPVLSATHVFTAASVAGFPRIAVMGFSGARGGYNIPGHENGNANSAATIQPGPCGVPSIDGAVVVTAVTINDPGATFFVDGPFVLPAGCSASGSGSNNNGIAIAHDIQTTKADRNPTWTNNFNAVASIAVWLPTGTGIPFATTLSSSRA